MQVTCINNTIPARWAQLINVIVNVHHLRSRRYGFYRQTPWAQMMQVPIQVPVALCLT